MLVFDTDQQIGAVFRGAGGLLANVAPPPYAFNAVFRGAGRFFADLLKVTPPKITSPGGYTPAGVFVKRTPPKPLRS
jgi:hypothetical protein